MRKAMPKPMDNIDSVLADWDAILAVA